MIKKIEKYGYYLLLSCIFLLGLLLRLKGLIANPSFWHDECALAWNVIHKNYGDFMGVLRFIQIAPPGFMFLSKFSTQVFGISDLSLRYVPFFFGISSMVMFFALSKKIFQNKITIITCNFLFAMNQPLINYSSEFKHYSCDVFFTILSIYLFVDIILKKASVKKIITYSIFLVLSIWFSFVSIFATTAGFLILFFKQLKEKELKTKENLILLVPLIISGLIYLKIYLINTYVSNKTGMSGYWASGFIAKDFSNFFGLFIANLKYMLYPVKLMLFVVSFLIFGIYTLFRKNYYPVSILLLTFLFECIAAWLGYYPFENRSILFLIPVFIIFICASLENLNLRSKLKSIIILTLFIITFFNLIVANYIYVFKMPNFNRRSYARQMMEIMINKIKPGEFILVNESSNPEFAYYSLFYDINNEIFYEPKYTNPFIWIKKMEKHGHYWLYLPYKPSYEIEKWLNNNKKAILYEVKDINKPGRLDYIQIK